MSDPDRGRLGATYDRLSERIGPYYGRAVSGIRRVPERTRAAATATDARLVAVVALLTYVAFVIVAILLGYGPNGTINTLQRITFLSAVYAMLVLALNLHWGYAGLFNIGVAGFMAVGVYTMAMLTGSPAGSPPGLGLPLSVGILGGVLAAALVGVVVALPAIRLRADYLAIVTLAFSEIIRLTYLSSTFQTFTIPGSWRVAIGSLPFVGAVPDVTVPLPWPDLALGTGAGQGINLPTNPVRSLYYVDPASPSAGLTAVGRLVLGGQDLIQDPVVIGWTYALAMIAFVAGFYWLLSRIGDSPFGRVLKAIREDELVAKALGKHTDQFKIKTFAVGCALMGLAGILWQGSRGYASPDSFAPIVTFYVFIALIIGGAGSNTGSVLGGAVFASFLFEGPNFLRRIVRRTVYFGASPNNFVEAVVPLASLDPLPFLAYVTDELTTLRLVFLGIVLIYLVQRRPEGLLGHRKEEAAAVDLSRRRDVSGGDRSE